MSFPMQIWRLLAFISFLITACVLSLQPRVNITVAVFGLSKPYILNALPYTLPGYLAGLDSIANQYSFNFTSTILSDTKSNNSRDCDDLAQYVYTVPEFYHKRPKDGSVFLLLHAGCYEIYELSAMSLEWNTLVFSSVGTAAANPKFSMDVFRNQVSSTVIDYPQTHAALRQVLKYFSWTTIAIVRDDDWMYRALSDMLNAINENTEEKLVITTFLFPRNFTNGYDELFSKVKASARIVFLLMHSKSVRDFLSKASEASMTNGEYVYLTIHPFFNERRYGKLSWMQNKTDDLVVREAFRSLLYITSTCRSEQFRNSSVIKVLKNKSIQKYGGIYWDAEEPTNAFLMYEMMKVGGQVINEAVQAGIDLHEGQKVSNMFRNRTFVTEEMIWNTDSYNRRLVDLCIKDFNAERGNWATNVLYYDAKDKMVSLLNDTVIDWNNPVNTPPFDEPLCGFSGLSPMCQSGRALTDRLWPVILVLVIMLTFVVVLVVVHRKREAKRMLGHTWWDFVIDIRDIHLGQPHKHSRGCRRHASSSGSSAKFTSSFGSASVLFDRKRRYL